MPKKLLVVANTSPLIALSAALTDFSVLGSVTERVLVPARRSGGRKGWRGA